MSFFNNPNATATITVDEPVLVTPGYDVATVYSYGFEDFSKTDYPSTQVYFQNFETNTLDGWALLSTGKLTNTLWGGSPLSQGQRSLTVGGNSVNTTPAFQRAFTGLTVGRSYTVSALATALAPSGSVSTNATATLVGGATSGTFVLSNTATTTVSLTFTATATSHTLRFTTWLGNSSTGDMATWDNITLTANAYTVINNNGLGGWGGSGAAGVNITPSNPRTGAYGLHTTVNTGAKILSYTKTGLTVGAWYRFEVWVRGLANTTFALEAGAATTPATVPAAANTYELRTLKFQASATSQLISVKINQASLGDSVIDDARLVRFVPEVTTLTPELDISEGDVTLDAGRYPYVEAHVTVPLDDEELLEQIETGARVVINATEGTTSTQLDLTLRSRKVSHDGKTIELDLASDEALMYGWADVVDDKTPRTYEADLRALCNYVLNKVSPGAALQSGTANADLTARWDATNAILNPNAVNTTGYAQAGNLTLSHSATANAGSEGTTGYLIGTSAAAGQAFISAPQTVNTRKGDMWTFSNYMHKGNGIAATLNGILRVYEMDAANNVLRQIESTPKPLPASGGAVPYTWERYSLTFVVENPNTTKLAMYGSFIATAAGQAVGMDGFMLTEGPLLLPFFSGSTAPAGYVTNWTGQSGPVANNSVSERKPADGIERMPDLFTWKAGQTAWDFLEPLVASAGLKLYADEQRRFWLIDPANYSVPGRFSARPDNTVQGTDVIDVEDEDSGVTGVVVNYTWTDADGITHEETDAAGVAGKVKVLRIEREFPRAGIAAAHLSKIQGQGRVQDVTTRTDYTVRPWQEVQIDLPGTFAQLGTLTRVQWELSTGLMSLGSAGLRETPPGSIDLLNGTIDGLSGAIDSL